MLYGGRRHVDEHQHTICWMPWYHVGEPPQGRIGGKVRQLTIEEATRFHGPSWCLDKAAFERRFATEGELLEMQNQLLEQYARALAA